jgi:S1-C subfamily serine protease
MIHHFSRVLEGFQRLLPFEVYASFGVGKRYLAPICLLAFLVLNGLGGNGTLIAQAYTPRFDSDEMENITVYATAAQAVVTINTVVDGHPSSGAGVIIDESGVILTSGHVIGDDEPNASTRPAHIAISLEDGRTLPATILGRMAGKSDLALLKIASPNVLPYLRLGDSTQVRVGQKVLAVGNPYGFERTLTTGIISRIDAPRNRIQTDAAINPGSSGGPLLDTQGYIIGINQSIYNPDGNRSNIGIGFAIPVNTVKTFLKTLAEQNPVPRTVVATSHQPVIRYENRSDDTEVGYKTVSIILNRVGNQP